MERWSPIAGFPLYEVSDHGRVRSKAYGHWKLRRLTALSSGYLYLPLRASLKSKPKNFYVHRLVAQAFVPGQGEVVMHKDDNRGNNHFSNLCWGSHAGNVADKVSKGRQQKGSKVSNSKLVEDTAREALALLHSGVSDSVVASQFGVSRSSMTYLRLRKTWKHIELTEAPD